MENENMSRCKDLSKNLRRGVQTAPEHERAFSVQEPIRHFCSAERHSKRAEFSPFGLWPNGLWMTIRHTLFYLFTKGCVRIHSSFFFFFLRSERHTFWDSKFLISADPLWDLLQKLRFFGFKDNWISFFEP